MKILLNTLGIQISIFFVITLSIVFTLNSATSPDIQTRIYDGSPSTKGQFPFQIFVSAEINETNPDGVKQVSECSGVLLSDSYVITAAHCLTSLNITLIFGVTDISNPYGDEVFYRYPRTAMIHPEYNSSRQSFLANDLAIIPVSPPINFTEYVQPITLPSWSDVNNTYEGQRATVTGWGYDETNRPSDLLRWTNLTVINNTNCFLDNVPERVICMEGDNEQSICFGDSGGPMFVSNEKNVLIGISNLSLGYNQTCSLFLPSLGVRITNFLDFIANNTDIIIKP